MNSHDATGEIATDRRHKRHSRKSHACLVSQQLVTTLPLLAARQKWRRRAISAKACSNAASTRFTSHRVVHDSAGVHSAPRRRALHSQGASSNFWWLAVTPRQIKRRVPSSGTAANTAERWNGNSIPPRRQAIRDVDGRPVAPRKRRSTSPARRPRQSAGHWRMPCPGHSARPPRRAALRRQRLRWP